MLEGTIPFVASHSAMRSSLIHGLLICANPICRMSFACEVGVGMSLALSVFVALLPAVASAPTCSEEMRICPTDKPIVSSPFELAYSRSVIRSRETPLGNLVAGASHSFMTSRHCP